MAEVWTDAEIAALRLAYEQAGDGKLDLSSLANEIGRSRAGVAAKASLLGLTKKDRMKTENGPADRRKFKGDNDAMLRHLSKVRKQQIVERGHPRGMLGKSHSAKTKAALSKASTVAQERVTREERNSRLAKAAKTRREIGFAPPQTKRGSWVAGWREVGDRRIYFRSRWEANYAFYLQWLLERGEIAAWEYEPKTFWFEEIKRGVRSYKPDFYVTENSGKSAYHEIKGWMDSRSKTTLRRMSKYYPDETVIVIREREYKAIRCQVMGLVPGWEDSARDAR